MSRDETTDAKFGDGVFIVEEHRHTNTSMVFVCFVFSFEGENEKEIKWSQCFSFWKKVFVVEHVE